MQWADNAVIWLISAILFEKIVGNLYKRINFLKVYSPRNKLGSVAVGPSLCIGSLCQSACVLLMAVPVYAAE